MSLTKLNAVKMCFGKDRRQEMLHELNQFTKKDVIKEQQILEAIYSSDGGRKVSSEGRFNHCLRGFTCRESHRDKTRIKIYFQKSETNVSVRVGIRGLS